RGSSELSEGRWPLARDQPAADAAHPAARTPSHHHPQPCRTGIQHHHRGQARRRSVDFARIRITRAGTAPACCGTARCLTPRGSQTPSARLGGSAWCLTPKGVRHLAKEKRRRPFPARRLDGPAGCLPPKGSQPPSARLGGSAVSDTGKVSDTLRKRRGGGHYMHTGWTVQLGV